MPMVEAGRLWASWSELIQLDIRRVGNGRSNSPDDELGEVHPTVMWSFHCS